MIRINLRPLLLILCFVSSAGVNAAAKDDLLGIWINQAGDGYIEISIQQGKYVGIIKGGTDPEAADRKDIHNPDPNLRNRSIQGITIMGDMTYSDNNEWSGGWIYDPNNGKTYKCKLKLTDRNTLKIRGYIGVSLFGRTETWKKDVG